MNDYGTSVIDRSHKRILSAVRAGDVGSVRAVLRAERDTAVARDAHGCSALHWALLLGGMRESVTDRFVCDARERAARDAAYTAIAALLLDAGARVLVRSARHRSTTVLDLCARVERKRWTAIGARVRRAAEREALADLAAGLCALDLPVLVVLCVANYWLPQRLAAVSGTPVLSLSAQWAIARAVQRKMRRPPLTARRAARRRL